MAQEPDPDLRAADALLDQGLVGPSIVHLFTAAERAVDLLSRRHAPGIARDRDENPHQFRARLLNALIAQGIVEPDCNGLLDRLNLERKRVGYRGKSASFTPELARADAARVARLLARAHEIAAPPHDPPTELQALSPNPPASAAPPPPEAPPASEDRAAQPKPVASSSGLRSWEMPGWLKWTVATAALIGVIALANSYVAPAAGLFVVGLIFHHFRVVAALALAAWLGLFVVIYGIELVKAL